MPAYKNGNYFSHMTGAAFDVLYKPGERAPLSGIYRCENCTDEIAHNGGNQLPPQNHHQHKSRLLPILWRLIAATRQAA